MTRSIVEFMLSPEGRALVNDACARASQENIDRGGTVATRMNGKTVIMTAVQAKSAMRDLDGSANCEIPIRG